MAEMLRTLSKGRIRENYIEKVPTVTATGHTIPRSTSLLSLTLTNHHFHNVISSPHTWRMLFAQWYPECHGQFTPLTVPPDPAIVKLHPDDLATNHWRIEAILRSRLLRNLSKAKPELRQAGERNMNNIEPKFQTSVVKTIPKSVIMSLNHNVRVPISHLFGNYSLDPLEALDPSSVNPPLEEHPPPTLRVVNAWNGDSSLWTPGDGKLVAEGGSMVVTRYERTEFTQGTSFDIHENLAVCVNGHSMACAGKKWGVNEGDVLFGFRMGSGEKMRAFSHSSWPHTLPGAGTDVWIADLAGLGCQPGVGLQADSDAACEDAKEGDEEVDVSYTEIPVPEASYLYTEYGLGIVVTTTEGEVRMYSAQTGPLYPDGAAFRPVEVDLMATWKLSPRCALMSVKVDNDYSPEKRAQGRPWCVAQNIVGEIWTFAGNPRPRQEVPPPEPVDYDDDLARADADIEDGPVGDSLRTMVSTERSAAFQRIRQELAASYQVERELSYQAELKAASVHVQGTWRMLEHSRVERPISGFYLDDLYRDSGIIMGDNANLKNIKLPWYLQVDFGGYNIITFSTRGVHEKRIQGFRYHLNSHFTEKVETPEDEILGGQGMMGSLDEWSKTRLRIPKSGEEIFDPDRNPQHITSIAMDCSELATTVPSSPNDTTMGMNARFLAIGTSHGKVFVYNIRGHPTKRTSDILTPLRTCKISGTPRITCLGLTSLALIVGASNGSISVFDPLGSVVAPIRKIVHAMTIEAKREYIKKVAFYGWSTAEMEESWAEETTAYAISMDPNARSWRGAAVLGANILYWDETDFLNWQEADDLARRKQRRMERLEQLKLEAEEAQKNRRSPKPRIGIAERSVAKKLDAASHRWTDEEELQKRWEAAHGDLSEEDKKLFRDISGVSLE